MPLKSDRTSYNVSNNLKTAMNGAGFDTNIKEGNTYYDGGPTEIHLVLLALPGGTFRTVSNLLTTFSDIVPADEAAFVRMWVESELAVQIAQLGTHHHFQRLGTNRHRHEKSGRDGQGAHQSAGFALNHTQTLKPPNTQKLKHTHTQK